MEGWWIRVDCDFEDVCVVVLFVFICGFIFDGVFVVHMFDVFYCEGMG